MSDVLDVGEVEEILVGPELETGLGSVIDVYDGWEDLDVAGAEDPCWAEGEC
jgi:hypothetical protein